jgi:broad specificity phosphatase PhoE
MPTFVFVRHGITDWNADGRFQGRLDIPLNAAGRRQAEILRDRLASISFDRIYTSPLRRAEETAQIVAGAQSIVSDWRLAEIDHGDWQGRTKQEIAVRWPDAWDAWNKDPLATATGGGESPEEVRRRVEDFLNTAAGEDVLCVSHGIVIQTVRRILLGARLEDSVTSPRNASVHTFLIPHRGMARYTVEELA